MTLHDVNPRTEMTPAEKKTLGQFARSMKVLRQKRCLNIKQLADKTGLVRQTLYTVEAGKQKVNLPTLVKIAEALNTNVQLMLEQGVSKRHKSPSHLRKIFGTNVRFYRYKLKMTKQELADAAAVSIATIYNIEKGINSTHLDIVDAICKVLGVKVSHMVTDQDHPFIPHT